MPDADLRRLIKGSPMTRARLTGLRRNVAVAIGNMGDAAVRGVLDEHSPDSPSAEDPIVQQQVARARG